MRSTLAVAAAAAAVLVACSSTATDTTATDTTATDQTAPPATATVTAEAVRTVSPDTFLAVVDEEVWSDDSRTLLDVRTPAEYAEGHLRDAVNADMSDPGFATWLADQPRDAAYAIYCRSGNRSGQVAAQMRELGFTDVVDLDGGIVDWPGEVVR